MDVFEDAAHPGVITGIRVGRRRASKGVEDIDDGAIAADIARQMLVNGLDSGDSVGAYILVWIVVIHHYQITRDLTTDRHGSSQLRQDRLRQVAIERGEISVKIRADRAVAGIDVAQQIVRADIQGDGTDLPLVELEDKRRQPRVEPRLYGNLRKYE